MCPQGKGAVLQTSLNQVFIACASQAGRRGQFDFLGSSILVDPYRWAGVGAVAGFRGPDHCHRGSHRRGQASPGVGRVNRLPGRPPHRPLFDLGRRPAVLNRPDPRGFRGSGWRVVKVWVRSWWRCSFYVLGCANR